MLLIIYNKRTGKTGHLQLNTLIEYTEKVNQTRKPTGWLPFPHLFPIFQKGCKKLAFFTAPSLYHLCNNALYCGIATVIHLAAVINSAHLEIVPLSVCGCGHYKQIQSRILIIIPLALTGNI